MAATVTHVLTQTVATNSLLNNLAGGMLVGGVLFGAGQTAATLAGIRALQREKATKDQMDKYMKQVSRAADVASKSLVTDVSNIISSQLLSMTFLTKNINQVVARISLAFQYAYPNANKTEIDGMLTVFKTELNKNVVQENKILTQASLQGQVKIGALPPPLPEPMNNGNGNNANPPPPPPPPDINPDQFNKKLKKKKKMYGLNINANTYNFEDGYISVATYIQYVRGKIAFEDFVNLVNAGINGWYLADYQAIQYIQTFPKLVYRVWNLIGKSNDSKVQSIQQLLKGWILSQITTVIQQAKRTLILIDTIVDSFPSWLELKVPNKYVTEEDDDKFTFIRASHEKQSLAIVLLAINCVLSLTQWHVFLINFSDILAQIYSSQYIIPWAQIRRIWKTSCFNIQKTSFYLENTRRKKYQVQEIAVKDKKIVPITHSEQKKKNWKQSYEQAYDEIKKKEKSISNYNTIVKDIKNRQYQFGEFSKFAVALQQYKQYQYKDIDNLIKEAFQSHFKAIQKSKCFDTKVQNILQSSWKQLTATIPAIRSLDDFQQFSVQPVGFFIEHMILPLNVFDLKSLLYQYIRSLIEFNMYVRIQGRALHSKYLKIDYQQVITGDYYIPIDDDYIFMRKSDRSIYYQINDKIIKKGQKLMLTFDQIKLIYETLKKYLKQKESKITMKALHQRIRIFMIKMGSDVRTLDEYFSKEQDKVIEGIQKVFNISLQQAKKNYNNLGTDVPQTAST